MSTQQTSDDMTRQTDRAGGRRLDSILRTLTVAIGLLIFGVSAPMVFADHMHPTPTPMPVMAGCSEEATSATPEADESSTGPLRRRGGVTGSNSIRSTTAIGLLATRPLAGLPR